MKFFGKLTQIALTTVLLFIAIYSSATVFYVSAEGDDANSGTSPAEAWKTLDKVNQYQFSAGDQVLFNRGDVWRGTLLISSSGSNGNPVSYGAYGDGANPLLYGSEVITDWTQHSENIYKATFSSKVAQVFVDGERIRVARYPNDGYLFVNSVQGDKQFTSNLLNDQMDYQGATWFGRTRYYFSEVRTVTASSGKSVTLNSAPSGALNANEGFFLMNRLEFLDQPGEWYYDESASTLYVWVPEGGSPENHLITGSVYPNGVYLNRVNHVKVSDFDIREFADNGVNIFGCNYVTVTQTFIANPEQYGIYSNGGGSHILSHNKIERANGGGMLIWSKDMHVTDNEINHTGIFAELGLRGTTANNGGSGAEISGENNIIEYNLIDNSNYNGLFYRGAGSVIQYNLINNSCLVKDDGGAIYTNTSGSEGHIRYNIVTNSIGNPVGFSSTRSMAEGIYIDEIAQNVIVEHNTVYNTGDAGIKLHHVGNIQVSNNTIMNARYGFFCNKFVGAPSPVTNNLVYMSSKTDDYEPRPLFVRVATYNTLFDNNKYINPNVYASTGVFRASSYVNLAGWQSATNQDYNSVVDLTPLAAGEVPELFYNATKSAKTFNLNGAIVRDTDGNSVTSAFSLEPYTSIILIGKNTDNIKEVVTNVDNIASNKLLNCYPNPFKNNISIETGIKVGDKFQVNIYDVTGTLIMRIAESSSRSFSGRIEWDGRDMKGNDVLPGMYLIQVISNGKTETEKVFKTR